MPKASDRKIGSSTFKGATLSPGGGRGGCAINVPKIAGKCTECDEDTPDMLMHLKIRHNFTVFDAEQHIKRNH